MKILKIVYIVCVYLCAFQLLVFLISPFGGPLGILSMMKSGMFSADKDGFGIATDEMYYPNNIQVKYLAWFNRICTTGYFMSLIVACLSLALIKIKPAIKYKIGIIFFLLSIVFTQLGGRLWRHYVTIYIENPKKGKS